MQLGQTRQIQMSSGAAISGVRRFYKERSWRRQYKMEIVIKPGERLTPGLAI